MSMDRQNGNGHRERDLGALVDLYLLRCAVEGKSPHTLKAYRETLGRFARIARDEGVPKDVAGITPAHLYVYLGRYTDHSMETRHRYFREVRCFFNWLVQAGYLKETPLRSLRNVRLPQRIVQPFSSEEVARLLACCYFLYAPIVAWIQRFAAFVQDLSGNQIDPSEYWGVYSGRGRKDAKDSEGAQNTRAQAKRVPARSQEGGEAQVTDSQPEEVASRTAPDRSGCCSATRTRSGSPEDA